MQMLREFCYLCASPRTTLLLHLIIPSIAIIVGLVNHPTIKASIAKEEKQQSIIRTVTDILGSRGGFQGSGGPCQRELANLREPD